MNTETRIDDVLREIEFELAQGAVSRDDLGKAIQQVRLFHGTLRAEIHASQGNALAPRELINRQLQLNDMMLTLLQEMNASLHDTQARLRRMSALAVNTTPQTGGGQARPSIDAEALPSVGELSFGADPAIATTWAERNTAALRGIAEESLAQKIDMRPVSVPLIGGLLTRARAALHEVVLFYVNRLAARQSRINGVFADTLLSTDRAEDA